jgi:hypothetical protein
MANIAPDGSQLRLLEETNQHKYIPPPDSGAYGDRNAKENEGIELSGLEPRCVDGFLLSQRNRKLTWTATSLGIVNIIQSPI